MTDRLSGHRVLITAAGAGIGRACALAFAREGADVLATDIDTEALATLHEQNARVAIRPLDVTDRSATAGIADGNFSVLVNCAGWVCAGDILASTEDDLDRAFALNVAAMARVTRAVLPQMLAVGRGSIVNIASVASSLHGVPDRFVYSTTKAAVIGLTKSIARDFVAGGIRCNAICPGTIDTPSLGQRMQATGDAEAARRAFIARQPMGRLGSAAEVAALALYLASDEAGFTTGAVHVIDGGWTA
jgi:2-keto-3-deoxy-L-fuconate dehydrogenase